MTAATVLIVVDAWSILRFLGYLFLIQLGAGVLAWFWGMASDYRRWHPQAPTAKATERAWAEAVRQAGEG